MFPRNKSGVNSPKGGKMQETGLMPNLASIKRLVQELGAMTVYNDNELKTFIYWAIGTYGHEHLSKFPLLYVRGSTGTGKTNTLKILNVLANGAEILNARSTYATARDDVDFVKTALFDEGDSLDHTLIESIFDKDTSKRKHKVKTDTDWTSVVRDLFTPTAFVGRNPLKDASNENRCIEILTRPVKDGTSKVLEVDVVAEYQEVCKEIGITIDWTAIASNDHTREGELWIPMRAVALYLGDEEYLQFIEDDIERLREQKEEDWDNVVDTNLKGCFNGIKSATRPMIKNKSGRIINITSVIGQIGNAGQCNYAASKAGVIGLTKSIAKELGSRNITVNAVAPGYITTDMTNELNDETKEQMKSSIPLGRLGTPNDVANLVCFLASDESGYITGQTLNVDGGMVMI